MAAMGDYTRVLVVALNERRADELAQILERSGCMVTSTVSVTTALDLAGYSEFEAVVVAEDVPPADRSYLSNADCATPAASGVRFQSQRALGNAAAHPGVQGSPPLVRCDTPTGGLGHTRFDIAARLLPFCMFQHMFNAV